MKESEEDRVLKERQQYINFGKDLAKRICKEIAFTLPDDVTRTACLGYVTVQIFVAFLNNLEEAGYQHAIALINQTVLESLESIKKNVD